MESIQKHIINKLTVDVETQNPRTAFDLKDSIDIFLKDEILPYLEDYFSSITEDLHSQTIQIPYLSVNVETSSGLNFKELKEDVKKEIIKEIKEITNPIKAIENDVVFIKRDQSKEKSIFHFLEQGTKPWWITSEEFFHFDDKEFYELLQSTSFQEKLKRKLANKQVQNRFINQFTNQQIHQTLQLLFHSNIESVLKEDVFKNIEKLSLKSRAFIWEYLTDFAINNNANSLASKLIFELTELIPELPNTKNTESVSDSKSKPAKNVYSSSKTTKEKSMVKTIVSILSKISKNQLALEAINLMVKNKTYYKQALDIDIQELVGNKLQFEQASQKINNDISHESPTAINRAVIEGQNEINVDKTQLETLTSKDSKIDKVKTENTLANKEQQAQNEKGKALDKEENKGKELDQTIIQETSGRSLEESQNKTVNKQTDKENQVKKYKTESQEVKNTIEKEESKKIKEQLLQRDKKESDLNPQNPTKKRLPKSIDKSLENKDEIEIENTLNEQGTDSIENNSSKISNEKTKSITKENFENKEDILNLSIEEVKKSTDNQLTINTVKGRGKVENKTKIIKESSLTDEEVLFNSKELKTSMSKLMKEKDRMHLQKNKAKKEETEMKEDLKGDYQINNAGLILLHPYLRDFFKHCDVLNDDNEITNPDLAVHLLHYLATKQELQFESNMLFEKILCGVPVKKSIQRNIKLSEELKANAEELLEAVLSNWNVLKNSSPDLLRNEFLQRFGKISFKDVNPKITVERKVHDILLEKLPWNIGISRLPWLDYLLFTDW